MVDVKVGSPEVRNPEQAAGIPTKPQRAPLRELVEQLSKQLVRLRT